MAFTGFGLRGWLGVGAALGCAGPAAATMTTLPVGVDLSSPFIVGNYTSYQVNGADMADRLRVTATFLDFATGGSITETRVWQLGGAPDEGLAVGSFWTLSQSGDTSFSPWRLDVSSGPAFPAPMIQSLRLEFENGNTLDGVVLDRFLDVVGTPGTATGHDFLVTDNAVFMDGMVAAPFYSLPADNPNDSVVGFFGDSFATLDVAFDGFQTAPGGYHIEFMQDTDLVVPTPGAACVLTLAGISALRRRR